jgi:xylose isomerase
MRNVRHHSICRWTFNAGKGGFTPGNIRPSWSEDNLKTEHIPALVAKHIKPRLPEHIKLGFEVHYDYEINEGNAEAVADAMGENDLPLAMITPGAHVHFGYGGIASCDPAEREKAIKYGEITVDLAYGVFRRVWDMEHVPTLVLWNGSWGYDLATMGVRTMYENLKANLAGLVRYEAEQGGELYICIEPKPNEGHPAMMPPTTASAILIWDRIAAQYGVDKSRLGVNKEIGHSEMIGLDAIYDTIEEIDAGTLFHTHLNSQGYNDGLLMGGPGKFDIDFGTRVNAFNVTLARLFLDAGYQRWFGHDMQARAYDNEQQAIDRVVRSILSWEACEQAAEKLDMNALNAALAARETAQVEDIMRESTIYAHKVFDELRG